MKNWIDFLNFNKEMFYCMKIMSNKNRIHVYLKFNYKFKKISSMIKEFN